MVSTQALLKVYSKVRRRLVSNAYYSPPNYRLSFLNIFGLQVVRYLFEWLRFEFKKRFWKPHDQTFSSVVRKNGFFTEKNFIDSGNVEALESRIEELVARERLKDKSEIAVFKDDIAIRLNINERYLRSANGRLDSCAWAIWEAIPFEKVLHYAEDVVCSKDYSSRQIEVEYIFVPPGSTDHYDHNTWWHADRHVHWKSFLFVNEHDEGNGTFEYYPYQEQSNSPGLL